MQHEALTYEAALAAISEMFGSRVQVVTTAFDGIMMFGWGELTHAVPTTMNTLSGDNPAFHTPMGESEFILFSFKPDEGSASAFGITRDSFVHAYKENNTVRVESNAGFIMVTENE